MSDIGSFPGYFQDDKNTDDKNSGHLRIVRMPSPVQSNCDAHDTIANGQYGASLKRYLGVLSGRERKPSGTETVEEFTTAVFERVSSSIYSSAGG
ncbi:hypothetical protein TNCV_2798271 [Trichonephila clavipes]|nr:hypothetical protein TNCV_2798271 [Trichonephila clavipes]